MEVLIVIPIVDDSRFFTGRFGEPQQEDTSQQNDI